MGINTNGVVFYQGASQIDGSPIVGILTGLTQGSANGKTGLLLQTWVLRADMAPNTAVTSGADDAICGDCIHRGSKASGKRRTCYVNLRAPVSVFHAYERGSYAVVSPEELGTMIAGRKLRLGAYGDPAAIPFDVWEAVAAKCEHSVGYTHQWRNCDPRFSQLCMASADTVADVASAKDAGFRSFLVIPMGSDMPRGMNRCPASPELKTGVQCSSCLQCDGTGNGRTKSIFIVAHGIAGNAYTGMSLPVING